MQPTQPQPVVPQSAFPQQPPPPPPPPVQPMQQSQPPHTQPQPPQQPYMVHPAAAPAPVAMPVTQPVSHTVYTDDGRRVSVDINFKMVGAPPAAGEFVQPSGYDSYAQAPEAYAPAAVPEHNASYGQLTQQNVEAQYGVQRPAPAGQAQSLQLQSLTSSANSAQFAKPAADQRGPQQVAYPMPRQPALAHPHEPLPRTNHAGAKPRQGFTKHPKAPPIVPRRAFDQYQQPPPQVGRACSGRSDVFLLRCAFTVQGFILVRSPELCPPSFEKGKNH